MRPLKILFVCIGNTCRSPMAESVMKDLIKQNDLSWEVDSAALKPWNVGRTPDVRCLKVLEENGLSCDHHGRIISAEDFKTYDYILGMDDHNLRELQTLAGELGKKCKAHIELLGSYAERGRNKYIRDPYFSTGMGGFRAAYTQIFESCQNFITEHMYPT